MIKFNRDDTKEFLRSANYGMGNFKLAQAQKKDELMSEDVIKHISGLSELLLFQMFEKVSKNNFKALETLMVEAMQRVCEEQNLDIIELTLKMETREDWVSWFKINANGSELETLFNLLTLAKL